MVTFDLVLDQAFDLTSDNECPDNNIMRKQDIRPKQTNSTFQSMSYHHAQFWA